MTEVLFYHLQRKPLEGVLPSLLDKCLERGWRVAVEIGDPERMAALDDHLWTYSEESFLPHTTDRDQDAPNQSIVLTTAPENPNKADVRFLVAGARAPEDAAAYLRLVLIFDGNDDNALALAREDWRKVKAAGHEATYWQQSERGRWEKRA